MLRVWFARRRWLLLLVFLGGCASVGLVNNPLDQLYGPSQPINRMVSDNTTHGQHFLNEVQPLLEKRCVVCHGCYDAPCQLKLSSPEGIDRGASKAKVYDGTRLLAAEPTRLNIDAHSTREWREKKFFPVLNERTQSTEINHSNSLIAALLDLKQQNPGPDHGLLDESQTPLGIYRPEQCAPQEELPKFASEHPSWGMPYALPALSKTEHDILQNWIAIGAPMAGKPELNSAYLADIDKWEKLLNQSSKKAQLSSRYIYEHWFLANLYFSDKPGEFFKLVRSSTPPGLPINIIATRRPYDDPQVKQVYYRLQRVEDSILAKTNMPYALNDARITWLNNLFFNADFSVEHLPNYEPETAANPFATFAQLPVESRYRLMLEESQFTIMGFINGPVCRGQIALNVIDDHFWAFFIDPKVYRGSHIDEFLIQQKDNLRLPGEKQSNAGVISDWISYSIANNRYLDAKTAAIKQIFPNGEINSMDLIWDGDGHNDNASLTIFRHFDSSTVVKGMVGQPTKTAWLIGYPLLERIHYLLVAEFDVYGNIGHQLLSRLYMDFLRMEGEFTFLSLLPQDERKKLIDYWYRDAGLDVKLHLSLWEKHITLPTSITYNSANPKQELYEKIHARLLPALNHHYDLPKNDALSSINRISGLPASIMPELSLIYMEEGKKSRLYTIMRNSGHSNITSLLYEDEKRLPAEDYLTLVPGVLGSYPNALWHLQNKDVSAFSEAIAQLKTEDDYHALKQRFAINRTSADFWQQSDAIYALYRQSEPIESGLLDYNRLENR